MIPLLYLLSVCFKKRSCKCWRCHRSELRVSLWLMKRQLRNVLPCAFVKICEVWLSPVWPCVQIELRNIFPALKKLLWYVEISPDVSCFCPCVSVLPRLKSHSRHAQKLSQIPSRIFKRPPLRLALFDNMQTRFYNFHAAPKVSLSLSLLRHNLEWKTRCTVELRVCREHRQAAHMFVHHTQAK